MNQSALVVSCSLLLAFFAQIPASAQSPEAAKLHIILVCDTKAENIGEGMKVNGDKLGEIFSEVFADRRDRLGSYQLAKEDQLTPKAVLDGIGALKVKAGEDSILFYYCGHGGWDDKKFSSGDEKGHFLAMSGGTLYRYQLRNALAAKKPFGVFILTDCCSNIAGFEPPRRNAPAVWEGFQDLFFRHRGFTDIQAASRTEFGWSDNQQGGFFTRTLTKLLCEPRKNLRPDRKDEFVSWKDMYPRLSKDTLDLFKKTRDAVQRRTDGKADIKDYEAQTPQDFYLAEWPRHARYVHIVNNTGEQLNLCIQYYHFTDGKWQWRGTPDTQNAIEYPLPAGHKGGIDDVEEEARWKVRAHKVVTWASTPSGRKFAKQEWTLAPDGGYRPVDGDDGVSPLTFK